MIMVVANSGWAAAFSMPLRLTAATRIVLSPTTLDFGPVTVGSRKTLQVTVSNNRRSKVTISSITATGSGFSVASTPLLPLVLGSGRSSTFTIAFSPISAGPASGSVSVAISGSSPTTKLLSGSGVVSGQLSVAPASMNFGTVALGSSQNQNGSLTATGAGVTVSSASWNGAGYSLSGITFPVTIPAGQSIPFTVTFAPQTTSSSAGNVSFFSNAPNSPIVEALSGSGLQTAHSVSVSWNASPSTVAGYNVYRGTQSGGPYVKLNSSLQPATTYTDNSVQPGAIYFYVVTAVDASSQESVFSNESTAAIPIP